MAQIAEKTYTAEEFERLQDASCYELDDGVLREWNVGFESQEVAVKLIARLLAHLAGTGLGRAVPPEVGLQIFPGRPRRIPRADGGFISSDRLPSGPSPRGFLTVAPELLFESVSPGDSGSEIERKVQEYLSAGVLLVWVLFPDTRTAMVYRADGSTAHLGPDEALDGEDVIPGFRCPLAEIMPPPETREA